MRLMLRDLPPGIEPPPQVAYFTLVMKLFQQALVKLNGPEELTDETRAKLRGYLERVFEAKDAVTGAEPKGGIYNTKD